MTDLTDRIVYCLVAKNELPLAQFSEYVGTFRRVVTKELLSVVETRSYGAYVYGQWVVYVHMTDGLTFLCLAGNELSQLVAFAFLAELAEPFLAKFGDSKALCSPLAMEMQRTFEPTMRSLMAQYRSLKRHESMTRTQVLSQTAIKSIYTADITHEVPFSARTKMLVVDPSGARLGHVNAFGLDGAGQADALAAAPDDDDELAPGCWDRHPFLVIVLLGFFLLLASIYVIVLEPYCGWTFQRVDPVTGNSTCVLFSSSSAHRVM